MRRRAVVALALLAAVGLAVPSAAQTVARFLGALFGNPSAATGYADWFRAEHAYRLRVQSSASQAADVALTWPATDGDAGQALTTDGSGVLSWVTLAAVSHAHAAGDITSGTLAHERGGLEADVSAYAGLLKIAGGITSAVTVSAAGETLIGASDASAQRTALGLGTISTQAANNVSITGGSITGITDLALADGGTGNSLADPNADRVLFWDDSAGILTWLTLGTGLAITDTTLNATASGATTALDNLASVAINTDLLPGVAATRSLGSSTYTWKNLFLSEDSASTSVGVSVLNLYASSSGVVAAGFGPFITAYGESSTTAGRDMGGFGLVWDTATDASRKSAFRIRTVGGNTPTLGTALDVKRLYESNYGDYVRITSGHPYTQFHNSNSGGMWFFSAYGADVTPTQGYNTVALTPSVTGDGSGWHWRPIYNSGVGNLDFYITGGGVPIVGTPGTNSAAGDLYLSAGQGSGSYAAQDVVTRTWIVEASGTTRQTASERGRVLGSYTSLTEATPTDFARCAIASGTAVGGTIEVAVEANDQTDYQARTLIASWAASNKAGSLAMGLSTPMEQVAASAGTLTCTLTLEDATGGNLDFKADCTSSLAQTTLRANARVTKNFGSGSCLAL